MGCEKTDEVRGWTGDSSALSGPVSGGTCPEERNQVRGVVWAPVPGQPGHRLWSQRA